MASPNCCALLAASSLLSPLLSFPNSALYNNTLASYTTTQEGTLHPSCFLSPTTSAQVAAAVSILASPANPECQFAIKGHTHMPAAGFANLNGGVTIDMTGLNSLAVVDEKEGKVVQIGGGAKWLDVYKYLDAYELAVAGGRNGDVGVGGFLLGGGISYFGPRVGWGCDTVVNYEIVLATGQIVSANCTSHPDLYRALKGGGNNFGIVTRFDLAPIHFPDGSLIAGAVVSDFSNPDHKAAVFDAFSNLANAKAYDPFASIVLGMTTTSTAGGVWNVNSTAMYTKVPDGASPGDIVDTPAAYEGLVDVPGTNATFVVRKLAELSDEGVTPQLNWHFTTSTYPASSPSLLLSIFNTFNTTISSFTLPPNPATNTSLPLTWSLAFEPLPTLMTAPGANQNILGTTPADGNEVIILLAAIWPSDPATDEETNKAVQAITTQMIEEADELAMKVDVMGRGDGRFRYMNYADLSQDVIGSYGVGNEVFLRGVSGAFDPRGVWSSASVGRVKGGFKLFG